MFLPHGSEWTLWVYGLPVISCGDRPLSCFMLCKQIRPISSSGSECNCGDRDTAWEPLVLWTTSRTWHSRTGHLTKKEQLYFENGWWTKRDPGVTVVLPPFPKTSTMQCTVHLFRWLLSGLNLQKDIDWTELKPNLERLKLFITEKVALHWDFFFLKWINS